MVNNWLTIGLRNKTKVLFEKKLGRDVSDEEAEEISINLAMFVKHTLEFYERNAK